MNHGIVASPYFCGISTCTIFYLTAVLLMHLSHVRLFGFIELLYIVINLVGDVGILSVAVFTWYFYHYYRKEATFIWHAE